MSAVDLNRPGAWTELFPHARKLMRHLASLSDVAESITSEYEEHAEFVKLSLAAGEIDNVMGDDMALPSCTAFKPELPR